MQGVLPSEVAQIPQAQISNLEVHQPQGRHDAESEGRELPLSIQCHAVKESCAPSSGNRSPGRLPMQGVLPSKVAQIPAQISNLEVHQVELEPVEHVVELELMLEVEVLVELLVLVELTVELVLVLDVEVLVLVVVLVVVVVECEH